MVGDKLSLSVQYDDNTFVLKGLTKIRSTLVIISEAWASNLWYFFNVVYKTTLYSLVNLKHVC